MGLKTALQLGERKKKQKQNFSTMKTLFKKKSVVEFGEEREVEEGMDEYLKSYYPEFVVVSSDLNSLHTFV